MPVCLVHKKDGRMEVLSAEAFANMSKIGAPMDAFALQVILHPSTFPITFGCTLPCLCFSHGCSPGLYAASGGR